MFGPRVPRGASSRTPGAFSAWNRNARRAAEPREETRKMLAHEHGRVAVVGLPRDVDARLRTRGHGARPCIRAAPPASPRARAPCGAVQRRAGSAVISATSPACSTVPTLRRVELAHSSAQPRDLRRLQVVSATCCGSPGSKARSRASSGAPFSLPVRATLGPTPYSTPRRAPPRPRGLHKDTRRADKPLDGRGQVLHFGKMLDGAFEGAGADVRFLPAATPTPERMTAVLAQVHKTATRQVFV